MSCAALPSRPRLSVAIVCLAAAGAPALGQSLPPPELTTPKGPAATNASQEQAGTPAAKIEAILRKKTSFSFVQAPLEDALPLLAHKCGIAIVLDRGALAKAGRSPKMAITREFTDRISTFLPLADAARISESLNASGK